MEHANAAECKLPTVTPRDRLFHAVMSLRTEHGDQLNADDAAELFAAICAVIPPPPDLDRKD